MSSDAYELQVYRSRWEGYDTSEMPEWDGELVLFPDWEYVKVAFWKPQPMTNLPERIDFDAGYEDLPRMALLHNDAQWPILSQQVLNTLLSVGEFSYQAIPLVMVDNELDWFTDVRTGRESHDYLGLQLLEHLDVFDWEQSVYERNSINPNTLNKLDQLVLKAPPQGYPPIFRVSTLPRRLFVSSQARTALEAAGLQGMKFIPLDEFELHSEDFFTPGPHPDLRPRMSREAFENINNPPYDEKFLTYNYQRALFEPISGYLFCHGSKDGGDLDILQSLTPGQRLLVALIEFAGQICNGGIGQFFYNKSEYYWWQALQALDQIGDREMGKAYAIELQHNYDPMTQRLRLERLAQCKGLTDYLSYAAQYRKTPPPYAKTGRFSWDYFYDHQREMETKLIDYIHTHPDEFVIFSD